MKPERNILSFIFFLFALQNFNLLFAQEQFIDARTRFLFDSLQQRITFLENNVNSQSENRDAQYFFNRRELDMTVFRLQYEKFIFDEELEEADILIDSRIKSAEKRADQYAIDFYRSYNTKLTKLRGEKRTYYQTLLNKESSFKKEFEKFTKVGDEYSLKRAERMVDLALNYARDQNMKNAETFLVKYEKLVDALIFDYFSVYDLEKLTSSEKKFLKTVQPLIENDSLAVIKEAAVITDQSYHYASARKCKTTPEFFAAQKIVVANALADWNERQGIKAELATLTGQAVIARLDTINRPGIYRWKQMILVVGSVDFTSKSDAVRRGEAIINADRTILNYVRVNRLANVTSKSAKIGHTYVLPYKVEGEKSNFMFLPSSGQWQYMIGYTMVINENVTEEIRRFLPPLQFQEELSENL